MPISRVPNYILDEEVHGDLEGGGGRVRVLGAEGPQ